MSEVVVAYIPVLHEGYKRFLDAHAHGRRLFLIGPPLYADYRPLAKDIRCLDAELVAASISAWGICSEVSVLDVDGAARLAAERPAITLPAEDVSYQVVERFFGRCEIRYDTVFLRWDKSKSAQLLVPAAAEPVSGDQAIADIAAAAEAQAARSIDWWRQVGAAIRFSDGAIVSATNEHLPHRLSAYAAGDPRGNFFKGVSLELSTAAHAEARLIAQAARDGISTKGAVMYATDFPCPPCAKLIAAAGVARLYFRTGYAVLDGEDVLEAAGVELMRVAQDDVAHHQQ
ncbi:MAG TPA: deaminase [Solirubrobacteraceae bacterium]|nr:deaminase [Solirubrobacteraceae bacterium]